MIILQSVRELLLATSSAVNVLVLDELELVELPELLELEFELLEVQPTSKIAIINTATNFVILEFNFMYFVFKSFTIVQEGCEFPKSLKLV